MALPPFIRSPTCPKCDHDGISFHYYDSKSLSLGEWKQVASCGATNSDHFEEHIHLVCARCDYGDKVPWIMATSPQARQVGFVPRVTTNLVVE